MFAGEGVRYTCAAFGQALIAAVSTTAIPNVRNLCVACASRSGPTQRRSVQWKQTRAAICLGLMWLSLSAVVRAADNQTAQEVVGRVARLFSSQSSIAAVDMQITKPDFQRQISMQFWSIGESKILVRIRQPPEDAGTAILKLGDNAWMFLPKANRTVEMPASMMTTSWMGSDFTLEDLVGQSRLTSDYLIATSFEGERNGIAVTEYALTPKPAAAVVWGKITLEVRQADLMPIWQHYYDENGKLVRELSFSDYAYVSGRLIPTRLVMHPLDQPGEQTTIAYDNIIFDKPISDEMFLLKNLKP
jgi:outer membrane lipoprotein-sorting protein